MAPDIADGHIGYVETKVEEAPVTLCSKTNENNNCLKAVKTDVIDDDDKKPKEKWHGFKSDIKWLNASLIILFHMIAVYGLCIFPYIEKWRTGLFEAAIGMCAAFGVTGGVHRLWSHKAYKARTPLKIFVSFCYLTAGQNTIYEWVRDHRVHHKYSETDADPHNSNRGFFFSHVGWLMLKKHPEVLKKGQQLDMSDIVNDPVIAFVDKYFVPLKTMICFVLPIVIPVYCWNEEWYASFLAATARYIFSLNATWSVNSFAHFFGNKPYDKNIAPVENAFVAYVAFGEGWHNYHHMFPNDYRAAEIGGGRHNPTAKVIDMFAKIGWAYDLKTPSEQLIKKTIAKRGDGTHEHAKEIAREFDY